MVDPSAHNMWFEFITKKFITRLKSEGFSDIIFTRVLSEQTENHYTYSLQTPLKDISEYNRYNDEIFKDYIDISTPIFGAKVMFFNSLLKKIDYER